MIDLSIYSLEELEDMIMFSNDTKFLSNVYNSTSNIDIKCLVASNDCTEKSIIEDFFKIPKRFKFEK